MPPDPSYGGGGGAATPPSKPQSPLRIAHDGEFYARLLTRESALTHPSFRYYGAGPGAVPFVWESQPGTPKDAYSSDASRMLAGSGAVAPAITPPPSYHLRGAGALGGPTSCSRRLHGKAVRGKYCGGYRLKWIKVSFIATVFRRLAFCRPRPSSSTPASAKPSSSSTRWLFSGSSAAEEAPNQEYCYEPAPSRKGVLCLGVRSTPWAVHFCGGGGGAGQRKPG